MTDGMDNQDQKTGKAGGIRLPPNKLSEVTKAFKYLDATAVVAAAAEFFSELPARASVHVQVSWDNLKEKGVALTDKGFAIVTQFLKYGQEIARLMQNLTRENKEILRLKFGLNVSGPSG